MYEEILPNRGTGRNLVSMSVEVVIISYRTFALPQFGGSPLYQACKLDLPETARALLEHGASVVHAYKGKTPLEVALSHKQSRCVKVGNY